MVLAISGNWVLGWGLGLVVVLLVAVLVLAIARLAQRVRQQAHDITQALDGTRHNTDPLWAVKETNNKLDRITSGLQRVLTGGGR